MASHCLISTQATPLYIAATRGATSAAVALLDAGADPDLSIDNGETPLLAAIEGDFIQVVRALLSEEAEAPVRTADPNKGTQSSSVRQAPLLLAVARGRVDAAAVLCVEINQCVGYTRQFFAKSFLGDDAADLARSSRRRVDGVNAA